MDKANFPEEIIDLVNEKDEVIGVITRKEAHTNAALIHREVDVIIVDDKKRILIQKRSQKKKVFPGLWVDSAGGHIPAGTNPELGAHKELKEELGFDTNLKFIKKSFSKKSTESRFKYWYIGSFPKDASINIDSTEVEEAKFVTKEEYEVIAKEQNLHQYLFYEIFQSYWRGEI